MWKLSIDFNINLPGVLPYLSQLENRIMGKIDELNQKADALITNTEESNAKTDALILAQAQTRDELVALRGQIANGEIVTVEQLQAVIDKIDAAITKQNEQDTETDAAVNEAGGGGGTPTP